MRLSLFVLLLCVLYSPASAQSTDPDAFRATTVVKDGEFVLEGRGLHRSSMAPLVIQDLPAGRYWITLYRDREKLSKIRMDSGRVLELDDRRGSRAILSTVFPGLGQLRDLDFFSALVPFLEVSSALTQTLRFSSDADNAQDKLNRLLGAEPSDPDDQERWEIAVSTTSGEVWVAEQARNNYGIATAYFHVGNILNAAVRRGPLRFQLSGKNSVAVNYVPPSRPWVGALALLYPGLGHTRMGHETRGLIWSGVSFFGVMGLIEAQREYDYRQTVVDTELVRAQQEIDSGGLTQETLAALAAAESEEDSAKGLRNGFMIGLGAVWLLNIADAVFLSDLPPIPLNDGSIAGIQMHVEPSWFGDGPALALVGSF